MRCAVDGCSPVCSLICLQRHRILVRRQHVEQRESCAPAPGSSGFWLLVLHEVIVASLQFCIAEHQLHFACAKRSASGIGDRESCWRGSARSRRRHAGSSGQARPRRARAHRAFQRGRVGAGDVVAGGQQARRDRAAAGAAARACSERWRASRPPRAAPSASAGQVPARRRASAWASVAAAVACRPRSTQCARAADDEGEHARRGRRVRPGRRRTAPALRRRRAAPASAAAGARPRSAGRR